MGETCSVHDETRMNGGMDERWGGAALVLGYLTRADSGAWIYWWMHQDLNLGPIAREFNLQVGHPRP
jgi:hypothetical protein